MNKLILRNEVNNLSDLDALNIVSKVVALGRISETYKGKQYCFVSTCKSEDNRNIVIYAYKNKDSDGFILRTEAKRPNV